MLRHSRILQGSFLNWNASVLAKDVFTQWESNWKILCVFHGHHHVSSWKFNPFRKPGNLFTLLAQVFLHTILKGCLQKISQASNVGLAQDCQILIASCQQKALISVNGSSRFNPCLWHFICTLLQTHSSNASLKIDTLTLALCLIEISNTHQSSSGNSRYLYLHFLEAQN